MKFDFQTFANNIMQGAAMGAQLYDQRQEQGKSLHQSDYIHLGIMALGAILSSFSKQPTNAAQ